MDDEFEQADSVRLDGTLKISDAESNLKGKVVTPATIAAALTVVLQPGDAFIVPKGVRHNPVAEQECHVLLIERKSTRHTGNAITEKTRSIAEQLRGV
jgi:hypothetical protein